MSDKEASNKNFNLFGSQREINQEARITSENRGIKSGELLKLLTVIRSLQAQLDLKPSDAQLVQAQLTSLEEGARSSGHSDETKSRLISLRDILSKTTTSIVSSGIVTMISEFLKS